MDFGKTVTISSSDELLARFAEKFANEDVAGFSWRVVALSSGVEVRLEGKGEKLILPVRARLHPSRQWLKEAAEVQTAVLLAPHIPELLAADLRRTAINHADLNGRLFLTTDWALIDRRPAERSHRSPGTALDVFSQKTSRLARCLLAHREREWTQEELTGRTGLSRGLISRALTYLVQEEFVRREAKATRENPARYRVQAFDRLLDAWQQADRWHERTELHEFSVLTGDPVELAADVRELLRGKDGQVAGVYTQWFAARQRHAYTDSPVVSVYVRQLPKSLPQFARPVASGVNLWLLVPKDEGVFQETQEAAGYPLVSDAQIYLDLLQVEGRGPEQAKALRNWEGFAR